MNKVETVTKYNPIHKLIHKTTVFPDGRKVETIRTRDLGTFVKVTDPKKPKVEVHQLPNDVYDRSEKMAKIFTMCDEEV